MLDTHHDSPSNNDAPREKNAAFPLSSSASPREVGPASSDEASHALFEEHTRTQAEQLEQECTFRAFRSSQALLTPLGTALLIAAFGMRHLFSFVQVDAGSDGRALGEFLDSTLAVLSKHFIDTDYAQTHLLSMLAFLATLILGIWLIQKGRKQREEFQGAHAFLNYLSNAEELKESHRRGNRLKLAGVAAILAAVAVHVATSALDPAATYGMEALFATNGSPLYHVVESVVVFLFAGGVFLIMRGGRIAHAPSYFQYNLDALSRRSKFEVEADARGPFRIALLASKKQLDDAHRIGTIAFGVSAVISACLFFLPTLDTPLWWVPLALGIAIRLFLHNRAELKCRREFGSLYDAQASAQTSSQTDA